MNTKIYDDQLIVITGAAGFIGSGVVKYLNDKGLKNLVLVDDLGDDEKWKNLLGKDYAEFVAIDKLFDFLEGKERDIEAIIHLGACSDTTETDCDFLVDINYRYSVKLAEYALKHGHRFIYASSAATYGDGSLGFNDDPEMIAQLKPLNMYGYSKQMFDLWVKNEGLLDTVVGLKYFNIFGPNESHKERMASMVYHMTHQIEDKGKVALFKSNDKKYGDGEQVRDFFYVKDAVARTCDFLDNGVSGIYNVGSGKTSTWNQLAKAIFKAMDKPEKIEYIQMPLDLHGKYQNYTCADLKRYQSALKEAGRKKPKEHTLEDGVADYLKNYLLKETTW